MAMPKFDEFPNHDTRLVQARCVAAPRRLATGTG